jgi:hypothetical protein
MGSRLGNPCFGAERHAAIVMRRESARIGRDRPLILHNGVIAPAERAQNVAEVVPRAGAIWAKRDSALSMRQSFRQAIDVLKQRG